MRKPILLVVLSILLCANICNAQSGAIITTIAGSGSPGYTGDGGPASAAAIGQPYGLAIDNSNNIYFTDNAHGVVRKINSGGIISTVVTGINPEDVAVDASGNVYIADGLSYRIRKVTPAGVMTTFAGNGTSGNTGDGGPATAATIGLTYGVVVDGAGNVYFSDYDHHVVRKVNALGIITTIAGHGVGIYSGDGGPATAAGLKSPVGLAIDASGNIYIADDSNYVVRKINPSGIISTFAGNGTSGFAGDGGPATTAKFVNPFHVAINSNGDIYITDLSDWRVRRVNPAGDIYTFAGNGTNTCSGYGGFAIGVGITPVGVAVDNSNNIIIANQGCAFINKIRLLPSVISDSFSVYFDNLCNGVSITAIANSSSPLNLKISYGDLASGFGTFTASTTGYEFVNFIHNYSNSGTYTVKMVLLNGTTPIDSAKYSYNSLLCNTFPVKFYYDANSNCIKDSSEPFNYLPITTEVDSNGVAIDTISTTSGFDYSAYGNPGDIYSFRVLSVPTGMFASCPAGGVVSDTLQTGVYNTSAKNMALSCNSGSSFDLAEYVITQSGRHLFTGDILINNIYCNPVPATFTANLDLKYNFVHAVPAPTSVTGNTIIWNLGSVATTLPQLHINFSCEVPGTWLTPGDTINTDYTVNPTTGDINPGNNYCVRTDTVKSSFDPNEMSVNPEGYIPSGTQLQYTIDFENTGNDTAHNIYVMDTLSNNVIPSSLRMLASSAVMDIIPIKAGGYNIVKFDFPNIKLLDSSHHNQCNGMVMFTINTKSGLPNGTTIFNHAGIFFDDNPVVMTNTVEDIIGHPSYVATVNKALNIEIYPNPATDELTIKMDKGAYNSFTITNSVGQVFMQQQLSTTQTTINVKTLPAGLYYITLRGENGTKVQKFVKM